MNEEILRVTPDGEFIWHNNADKLIETGDFTEAPAMPHILRRLRQRDALLKALKEAEPFLALGVRKEARAAIKAVEDGK